MLCGKCKRLPVLYVVVKESWSCLAVVHLHALVQQHAGKGLSLAAVKCDEAVWAVAAGPEREHPSVFSTLLLWVRCPGSYKAGMAVGGRMVGGMFFACRTSFDLALTCGRSAEAVMRLCNTYWQECRG